MEFLGIIGLFLAVAVMVVGAYKGLGALPLTILSALVVMLTNGMPIWTSYANFYMLGYANTYRNFFLMFVASCLFAKFMSITGGAVSIGYQLVDWFGKKNALMVSTLVVAILTYGGVSLFVVIFACLPIIFMLFKEADIPRHMATAPLYAGSATFTMTSLPGTPALTNIIPSQFLNTPLTAAPIMGIVCSVMLFVLCMVYMNYEEKKCRERGEHWSYPDNFNPALYELKDRTSLPPSWKAFVPMVALLIIIIGGGRVKLPDADGVLVAINATMLATGAMLVACVLTLLLNMDRFKGQNMKKIITEGAGDAVGGIGGLAAVVGFGTVVSNSGAFQKVVDWVLGLQLNPYVKGVVATGVIAGVTGSSSGGLNIMFNSLGDMFLNSGANLEILHRIVANAASSLDTLPHSSGAFLTFALLSVTHKEAYKHAFMTTVVITTFVTAVITAYAVMFC